MANERVSNVTGAEIDAAAHAIEMGTDLSLSWEEFCNIAALALSALRSPHQGEVEAVGYVSEQALESLRGGGPFQHIYGVPIGGHKYPLYLQPPVPKAGEEQLRMPHSGVPLSKVVEEIEADTFRALQARLEAAERENKALREALEPFAKKYDECRPDAEDVRRGLARDLDTSPAEELAMIMPTIGDLRRARAALVQP